MSDSNKIVSLEQMKNGIKPAVNEAEISFYSTSGFELMQRGAKLLANSTIVPEDYREVNKKGGINPSAISNCVVAVNMAKRLGADPLMIMQNLHVIEGRPSWSSQFIVASINSCGKYTPLRFDIVRSEKPMDVVYEYTEWVNQRRQVAKKTETITDITCVAWVIEKATGDRLESPVVSLEMAVKEGWYSKLGSKWKTMPEVMLRYRAAAFFGRIYAPELLMGLQTAEEVVDTTFNLEYSGGNSYEIVTTVDAIVSSQEEVDEQTGEVIEPKPEEKKEKKVAKPRKEKEEVENQKPLVSPVQEIVQEEVPNLVEENATEEQQEQPQLQEESQPEDMLTVFCPKKLHDIDTEKCNDCSMRVGCPSHG